MEEEIAEVVREHGWFAASISDHKPPFLYSIGLLQTWDHPELVVFGLDPAESHALISEMVREIRAGGSFAQQGVYTVTSPGKDDRVAVRRVHPARHPLYLGFAMGYCSRLRRVGGLSAIQAFWPDPSGKFPFEAGCDLEVHRRQPRLDLGLTPSEITESERQWE